MPEALHCPRGLLCPASAESGDQSHTSCCLTLRRASAAKGIRSSQYAAGVYQRALQRHGIVASMSRMGDCWDNAVMERFFGSVKREWTQGVAVRDAR